MSSPTTRPKLVRSVRVADPELNTILDKLNDTLTEASKDKLGAKKFAYRAKSCTIHMQQPGELESTSYSAPTHTLSENTLGFLHGGYVHVGSKCLAQLTTLHGAWQNIAGKVCRCELAERGLHDVEMEFEHEIQPADFVASAHRPRVLLVDDDPSTARLANFHLSKLNAIVEHVPDGETAISRAMKNDYDVILMDMEMPTMDGFETTRELRQQNYTRLIVAVTALTTQEDKDRCFEAGCDKYISKPLCQKDLIALVESLQREPLLSEFYNDPSMHELINTFLAELPGYLSQINAAISDGDRQQLAMAARRLKANGSGHGFGPISDLAASIEAAAAAEASDKDLTQLFFRLRDTCSLARHSARKT